MPLSDEEIVNRFSYHPPNAVAKDKHETVRTVLSDVAEMLNTILPESREQSLALTKLEEVMFWSNAAIARNR